MKPGLFELSATIIFFLAILHTFFVHKFSQLAHRYPEGSIQENLFHFLAEIEAVFGIWGALFLALTMVIETPSFPAHYLETLDFTEPVFVFVIMTMAATRPVIKLAENFILLLSKLLPLPGKLAFYFSSLSFGTLLGSFITEPAAMTVVAIILLKNFYSGAMSSKFKYATLGLLFVNISIGGTLSHFAAPPVLMVASKWGWGFGHMVGNFGYKAFVACLLSTAALCWVFRRELTGPFELRKEPSLPWWMTSMHVLFLVLVVINAHHLPMFVGLFLFFIGFTIVTQEYQDEIQIKSSLMVGFFLAGLIVLGSPQKWWLQPLITSVSDQLLYFGATALTGITDNAALTYLGSLVDLSDSAKYYLVAGAVSGGGLTVIANAPNPAGYGILKEAFGEDGIQPLGLLKASLFPTAVAILCFEFLPHF